MPAKDVLSKPEKKKVHGSGTSVSGYIESPVAKKCGTCEYIKQDRLCNQKTVLKDKQIKTDIKSGLKIVNPQTGCCDFWEAK